MHLSQLVHIYQHRLDPSCCTRFLLANGAPKMFRAANRVNVEAYPVLRHRASTVPNDLLHHWDSRIERVRARSSVRGLNKEMIQSWPTLRAIEDPVV